MKTYTANKAVPIKGMDERMPQAADAASLIVNFTVDQDGAWDNRIGYEKFFPAAASWAPFEMDGPTDGLAIWSTHNGARTYILYQEGQNLSYIRGNPAGLISLSTTRTSPAIDEVGLETTQIGRYLVIVNGHDEPSLWRGEQRLYTLGWWQTPSAPDVWNIDPVKAIALPVGLDPNTMQIFTVSRDAGLGSNVGGEANRYRWCYCWVFEDGSRSPMSPASEDVSWDTAGAGTSWANTRMVAFLDGIQRGPTGTVAREVYRTQNLKDWELATGEDQLFYYEGMLANNVDTTWYSHLADTQLGSLAPDAGESILMPCKSPHTAASYRNALFVAGKNDPTRIYFSLPGKPMQFRALDYFDVGTRAGGGVVKLFTYYDNLIVFRQHAIDIIRYVDDGTFALTPLVEGIGTEAGQSVDSIPGGGVVFLSYDGFYSISGSVVGGATLAVKPISGNIRDTMRRLNIPLMARAVGRYSPKWREYHCYFPADGSQHNTLGAVLHLQNSGWSLREDFPVGALAVDQNGEFIFGHATGNPSLSLNGLPTGLFVISGRRTKGEKSTLTPGGGYTLSDANPPTSTFRSAFVGDETVLDKPRYNYLMVKTTGSNAVPMEVIKDHDYSGTAATARQQQAPRGELQAVYDTAVWGTNIWEKSRLTAVRYDLPSIRSGASVAWEVETTDDLIICGYELQSVGDGRSEDAGRKA